MNTRVLELLKNPKNIQSEDLHLLKEEIHSFPYIQNIRALHLYGVHLYDKENYQKVLSATAAYTTDKKILYQLINGKIQQQIKPEVIKETPKEEILVKTEVKKAATHDYEAATACLLTHKPEKTTHLLLNGERNRVLFEGEENFLNEDNTQTIDIESTLESGIIVTQKTVSSLNNLPENDIEKAIVAEEQAGTSFETVIEEIKNDSELNNQKAESILPEVEIKSEEEIQSENISEINQKAEISEVLNPELIIEEEKLESKQIAEKINDSAELSFHSTDSFLPEVKIESKNTIEASKPEIQASNINKHEDEMRRLIEDVERKMKAKKESAPIKKEVEEEVINHDISFAETQAFHVGEKQKPAEKIIEKTPEPIQEKTIEVENSEEKIDNKKEIVIAEPKTETISAWKPMSFETNLPDSLVAQSNEIQQPKLETPKLEESQKEEVSEEKQTENTVEIITPVEFSEEKTETAEISQEKEATTPVMNVSFFGSDIASLGTSFKSYQKEKEETEALEKAAQSKIDDSNVPGFINTWQSWLKIDRTEEVKDKTEIKNKVIESFIEKNPKISQLKDEVNFVVKEKTDDISHLMTETLANLYIEQKLYTKAINAFQILANKHLDRKSYFEEKIQEIKDNRGKN